MIDINLINHIMRAVGEPGSDNNHTSWTDNVSLSYGMYIVNDEPMIYIKCVELHEPKETLVDLNIPESCFDDCRQRVRVLLSEALIAVD